ncbi:CPBP family intramembrane glutamic endopeptidase [Sanyastnella coralliicola]|uniref:CPBP family intramembrane glutamic endopeptidase n=1 Tax=Sanyastnella coralliicola TaxID=3069118 RepID=UPI0027B939B4|nr:CPBP family intramembrane glutamic endopeptidase [Longitalea sp. SCSIO 12813]
MDNPQLKPYHALLDLLIFLAVMFGTREIYIEVFGFWGNAFFRSILTVGTATILLKARNQSWKALGLTKSHSVIRVLIITGLVLVGTVASIMAFELFGRDLFTESVEENSPIHTIKDSSSMLLMTLIFVWIESFLEELQDRGFSLNRFEALLGKIPVSTVLAVLIQALIFGFRHSYDFSPRSVTTGLIGLIFGAAYVLSGRNLWPLISAHVVLNTISIID